MARFHMYIYLNVYILINKNILSEDYCGFHTEPCDRITGTGLAGMGAVCKKRVDTNTSIFIFFKFQLFKTIYFPYLCLLGQNRKTT